MCVCADIKSFKSNDKIDDSFLHEVVNLLETIRECKPLTRKLPYKIYRKQASKLTNVPRTDYTAVREFLTSVSSGTKTFWTPSSISANILEAAQSQLLESPIYETVYNLVHLEKSKVQDPILRIFNRVALYWLCRFHDAKAEEIAQTLHGVNLLADTAAVHLIQQIEAFILAGSRYWAIGEHLGGPAALFFLPRGKGDTFWERNLPKSGEPFDQTICILQQAGIPTEAEPWHDLAKAELSKKVDTMYASSQQATVIPVASCKSINTKRSKPASVKSSRKRPKTSNRGLERDLGKIESSNVVHNTVTLSGGSNMGPYELSAPHTLDVRYPVDISALKSGITENEPLSRSLAQEVDVHGNKDSHLDVQTRTDLPIFISDHAQSRPQHDLVSLPDFDTVTTTDVQPVILQNFDAHLEPWSLVDMPALLFSWTPDGEAYTVADEHRLPGGTEDSTG